MRTTLFSLLTITTHRSRTQQSPHILTRISFSLRQHPHPIIHFSLISFHDKRCKAHFCAAYKHIQGLGLRPISKNSFCLTEQLWLNVFSSRLKRLPSRVNPPISPLCQQLHAAFISRTEVANFSDGYLSWPTPNWSSTSSCWFHNPSDHRWNITALQIRFHYCRLLPTKAE